VNSYFQSRRKHSEHILEMLTQAKDLDVTVTGSALEAAVLESDEIKTFKPPYNMALREKDRYAPDVDVFKEGFQIFFDRYRSFMKKRTIRSALLRLGAIIWRKRQTEKEAGRIETADSLPLPATRFRRPRC
jgi:hypothetical protein